MATLKKYLIPGLFALLFVGVLFWIASSLWHRKTPSPVPDVITSEPGKAEVRDRATWDSLARE